MKNKTISITKANAYSLLFIPLIAIAVFYFLYGFSGIGINSDNVYYYTFGFSCFLLVSNIYP